MSDINFDQFKQEIRVAENYLRADSCLLSSGDGIMPPKIRSADCPCVVLDANRRETVLQQFGRRSLASSQDYITRMSSNIPSDENFLYNRSIFDGVSVSTDPYWKEGGRPTTTHSRDKRNHDNQPLSQYSDSSEREKLINRLLAEHDSKSAVSSAPLKTVNAANINHFDNFAENMNHYIQDSSSKLPSASSPDSLGSASDDEDTLFFASDLNPSIPVENGYDFNNSELPSSRQAPSYTSEVENYTARYNQFDTADVIRESYSANVHAFSRLAVADSQSYASGTDTSFVPAQNYGLSDLELIVDDTDSSGSALKSEVKSTTPVQHRYKNSSGREADSVAADHPASVPRSSHTAATAITGTSANIGTTSKTSKVAAEKKKFHKSREQLQVEAEASFKLQCAFKPTIATIPADSDYRRDSSGRARIDEMQQLYKRSREEREKQKKDFQQIELITCTFRPQITRLGVNSVRSRQKAGSPSPLFDAVDYLSGGTGYKTKAAPEAAHRGGAAAEASLRLHDEAEQRSAQQRWLERQVEEARLAQFTFQPAINPSCSGHSESMDHKPIYERVGELQREKEDRMRDLKQSLEDAQVELTFTPLIDSKSRRIAERRLESSEPEDHSSSVQQSEALDRSSRSAPQSDVGSRLHREALYVARRKEQLCSEREEVLEMEMVPAKPCRGTEKLAQHSQKVGASFADRQAMHSTRVQHNSDAQQRAAELEGAAWFKPEIGRSASIVASKRPELLSESVEDRVKRMSQAAAEGMERRRKAKEEELYGAMTFAPDIDPLSRAIGRTRGLQELVENKTGQKVRATAKIIADRIEESKCTFKPCINSYPASALRSNGSGGGGRGGDRAEERRYNADLAPVGWAECPLVASRGSFSMGVEGEEEGDTDEDSLEPLRHNCWQNPGDLGGLRSRHLDGKHQQQYRRCSVNLREPERMTRNIRLQQAAKEDKRRGELIAREIEEMKECTFQPSIASSGYGTAQSSSRSKWQEQQPVVVRGLGRHLELKHLSLRQREEASRREREVFSVRNIDSFRRDEDGSTIVKPFVFSEMSDRSYSRTPSASAWGPYDRNTQSQSTAPYNRIKAGTMQR